MNLAIWPFPEGGMAATGKLVRKHNRIIERELFMFFDDDPKCVVVACNNAPCDKIPVCADHVTGIDGKEMAAAMSGFIKDGNRHSLYDAVLSLAQQRYITAA